MKLNNLFNIKTLVHLALYVLALIIFPKFILFYLVCGVIDLTRNHRPDTYTVYQYFLGRGILTWLLSPLNLLIDLLTLSWRDRYNKQDLNPKVRAEIDDLLANINAKQLISTIDQQLHDNKRGMIFFKWYGKNIDNLVNHEQFHKKYKYIQTIGVSAFNKNCSTSRHFGPLRLTLRLLYNLQPRHHDGIYIEVNNYKHYWHNDPLLIFDDTHIHQSFNQADSIRYCLFVDFLRPSGLFLPVIRGLLSVVEFLMRKNSFIFYKNWKNIGKKSH